MASTTAAIAIKFSRHYYHLLRTDPNEIPRLYHDDAEVVRSGQADGDHFAAGERRAVGREAIAELFESNDESLLVIASGFITPRQGESIRHFTQTFVLSKKPEVAIYDIVNDVKRYQHKFITAQPKETASVATERASSSPTSAAPVVVLGLSDRNEFDSYNASERQFEDSQYGVAAMHAQDGVGVPLASVYDANPAEGDAPVTTESPPSTAAAEVDHTPPPQPTEQPSVPVTTTTPAAATNGVSEDSPRAPEAKKSKRSRRKGKSKNKNGHATNTADRQPQADQTSPQSASAEPTSELPAGRAHPVTQPRSNAPQHPPTFAFLAAKGRQHVAHVHVARKRAPREATADADSETQSPASAPAPPANPAAARAPKASGSQQPNPLFQDTTRVIFARPVPPKFSDQDIRDAFSPFGDVVDIHRPRQSGFAGAAIPLHCYIQFQDAEGAKRAVSADAVTLGERSLLRAHYRSDRSRGRGRGRGRRGRGRGRGRGSYRGRRDRPRGSS